MVPSGAFLQTFDFNVVYSARRTLFKRLAMEVEMRSIKSAAMIATAFAVSGCVESLDGGSAYSDRNGYGSGSYYGAPYYSPPQSYYAPPQGYYAPPQGFYAPPQSYYAPYPNQFAPRGREWRDHDNGREFRRDGFGQRGFDQGPQMRAQPGTLAPSAPPRQSVAPPPAARAPADQNQRAIDQLGFRPSR